MPPHLVPLYTLVSLAGNLSVQHVTVAVGQWVYIYELSRTAGGPFAAQIGYIWGTTPAVGPNRFAVTVPLNSTTVFDWLTPTDPPPAGVKTAPEQVYGVWRGLAFFLANNPGYAPPAPYDGISPGGAWQCTQGWIDSGPNPGAPSFELYLRADSFGGSVPYDVTMRIAVDNRAPGQFDFMVAGGLPGEPGGGLL